MRTRRLRVLVVADSGMGGAFVAQWSREFEGRRWSGGGDDWAALAAAEWDVVIVFDDPPGVDAVAICRAVRARDSARRRGILSVLAREDTERALQAFAAGADDCMALPCLPRVLAAHVNAIAWRYVQVLEKPAQKLRRGPLSLDLTRCRLEVTQRGRKRDVVLTHTQIELLSMLLARPGWVIRRAQLRQALRGDAGETLSHTLDAHIFNIRKKLGPLGRKLVSVKGVGYSFDPR